MSDRNSDLSRRAALRMLGGGAAALVARGSVAGSTTAPGAGNGASTGALDKAVSGEVIARGAAGFEAARHSLIWNQLVPDRAPDSIVRARSAADVAAAVRQARARGLRVALRAGGHNYHAASLREGGLLIDVGGMNDIRLDAAARRASVGPGVQGGQLLAALAPHDLAFPVGHCPDVSLGGYLLGGGLGWNFGAWGPACMSVRGVELVTAAGEILHADAGHNQDLYWAARGAGRGFFAAVTRYELTLHEQPRAMRALTLNFGQQSLQRVCAWFEQAIMSVHPSVEVIVFMPAAGKGEPPSLMVLAFAMADSQQAASNKFGSLRQPPADLGLVGAIDEQPADYAALFKGGTLPGGLRMTGDTRYSNAQLLPLMEQLRSAMLSSAQDPSFAMCVFRGGRALVPEIGDAAFSMQGQVFVGVYAFWAQPSEDARQRAWVRAAIQAVQPLSVGAYISEADLGAGPEVARMCYSPAAWRRLAALRQQHDPHDLFYGYT